MGASAARRTGRGDGGRRQPRRPALLRGLRLRHDGRSAGAGGVTAEPIRIRQATMGDYDALVALFDELDEFHRLAWQDVFRRFDGPARTRGQIEQWLAGPGSTVLVAEIDREVVGLAVLLTRSPSAFAGAVPLKVIELDNLVVHSSLRSQGVGRRLIEAIVDWSRGQGASHVGVAVHAFNRGARRFHERAGFAPSIDRLMLAV
ncbi:MAG: GNAT family N-acetyltransferase [Rhodospirillales bacterium]|nr:GNAT family N-acetyltransferase [Rhodospirillales bacterium]